MNSPAPAHLVKSTHMDSKPHQEGALFRVPKPVLRIPIEHNVPLSKALRRRSKYPYETMLPGDSFRVPDDVPMRSIRSSAYNEGRRLGMKFTCRMIEDGFRVWRVK